MNRSHRQHAGFTLIEMIFSMVILAIITASCVSVMRLVARTNSLSTAASSTANSISARQAMDMMNMDLKMATRIFSRSATSISFTVPDRDGDGDPELISYSWSGTAGDPIKRYYNSTFTSTILIDNITSLNFNYLDKTVTSPVPVESAEQLLQSYTATPNGTSSLSTTSWEAQYVNISTVLPANTITWKITKLSFLLKRKPLALGNVIVQVFATDASQKPVGSALATQSVAVSSISSTANTWVDFTLSTPIANLLPTTPMVFVIKSDQLLSNVTINGMVFSGPPTTTGMAECFTSTAGALWTPPSPAAVMDFKLYGKVTTPAP